MHLPLLPGLILLLAGLVPQTAGVAPTVPQAYNAPIYFSIAAQTNPTATLTTPASTGTVTATQVSTQTTPVALPTVAAQGNLKGNPFDWGFLTSAPTPRMGPFAWAFLVLMIVLFGAGAYFYFYQRRRWKGANPVWARAAARWGQIALWTAGVGLVFLLFRVISLDFFNLRLWLYVMVLAVLGLAGWFLYWWRTAYPKEMAKYEKTRRARQYMPGAAGRGAARQVAAQGAKPAPTPGSAAGQAANPRKNDRPRKRR